MLVPIRRNIVPISKNVIHSAGKSATLVPSDLQVKMSDISQGEPAGLLQSGEGIRSRGAKTMGTLKQKTAPQTKQKLQKFINLNF